MFSFPKQIETPRLILRPLNVCDAKMLNNAIHESFEILHQNMDWAKEKPTLEESEIFCKSEAIKWITKNKNINELMLIIIDKTTHDFIGATGWHAINWDVPSAETGYWIRTKYTGHGFITEAMNALTRYSFEEFKLQRLVITCDKSNEKSKKIPERLGFQLEAVHKLHRRKPTTGELSDTLVYVRNDIKNLPKLIVDW